MQQQQRQKVLRNKVFIHWYNHYFKIKSISNGKYLLGNKAGYEAQADTADSGMTFYFKASDLREYILFDRDSKYLTYNTFNAIVRNTTLSDKTRFKSRAV